MNIIITGANGQVGWELCRRAEQSGITAHGLDHTALDITDADAVSDSVERLQPNLIVNAAAYTQVDQAERESETAVAVNQQGPGHLAKACAAANIPLVHISTDYVFDGTTDTPYDENAPLAPLGVYGHSKAAGEESVRARLTQHVILRTSWVYGIHGNNFVKTMLRIGRERDVIGVVNDQWGCPTAAADIANAILSLAPSLPSGLPSVWGTYHYCGKGIITWFTFAEEIFRLARQNRYPYAPKVNAITTAEYPTPVKRPAYSALNCGRIAEAFNIHPRPWQESIAETLKAILL